MALTIVFRIYSGVPKRPNLIWHIGSSKKEMKDVNPDAIQEVHADGDELGTILHRFRNLPCLSGDEDSGYAMARGYVMTWYGDHAKFIVGNI